MNCGRCGNRKTPEYYFVCSECYSKAQNLPTRLTDCPWVTILNLDHRQEIAPTIQDAKLRQLILSSFDTEAIVPDRVRQVVVVGGRLDVPVKEDAIDNLAKRTGLVVGKWLIYQSAKTIDEAWKTVAASTFRNELGFDAKVSTANQPDSEYVICAYTKNYLDSDDVKRVRGRLKDLGFAERLFYKPDIYTYLKIYHRTFPGVRASKYSE